MAPTDEVIVYIYTFSPYSRKVAQYLTLRGIPLTTVEQPSVMPRPDLATIGVNYRRIIVLSIGRDIYCDTLFILQKLEELDPGNTLGAKDPKDRALEQLLDRWTSDIVFQLAVGTIPGDVLAMKDPAFCKDRREEARPTALKEAREEFDFLESLMGHG